MNLGYSAKSPNQSTGPSIDSSLERDNTGLAKEIGPLIGFDIWQNLAFVYLSFPSIELIFDGAFFLSRSVLSPHQCRHGALGSNRSLHRMRRFISSRPVSFTFSQRQNIVHCVLETYLYNFVNQQSPNVMGQNSKDRTVRYSSKPGAFRTDNIHNVHITENKDKYDLIALGSALCIATAT